jgi:hypothetical protein
MKTPPGWPVPSLDQTGEERLWVQEGRPAVTDLRLRIGSQRVAAKVVWIFTLH